MACDLVLVGKRILGLNISTKKLAVADLVGDNFTSLSKEEIEKIKDASDSVPG